jgi:hypothetical protein
MRKLSTITRKIMNINPTLGRTNYEENLGHRGRKT